MEVLVLLYIVYFSWWQFLTIHSLIYRLWGTHESYTTKRQLNGSQWSFT